MHDDGHFDRVAACDDDASADRLHQAAVDPVVHLPAEPVGGGAALELGVGATSPPPDGGG